MPPIDWDSLTRRILSGESQALGELQAVLEERVRGAARPLRRDIAHEILLAILHRNQSERLPAIRNLEAYCARILWTETARALRHSNRQEPLPDDASAESPTDDRDLLDGLARAELRREVRRVIATLPPAQAEILVLIDGAGLSVPRMAAWLESRGRQRSVLAVEGLLKRARKALRERLTRRFRT